MIWVNDYLLKGHLGTWILTEKPYQLRISPLSPGVSTATVSRIINKNGRYSEETERRVLEVIEKYNYQPNQLARSLRTDKTRIVGILVPDLTIEQYSLLTLLLQRELLKYDYNVVLCNTDDEPEIEVKYLSMLTAQKVSGIIYLAGGYHHPRILPPNVPVMYIDRTPYEFPPAEKIICIKSDNRLGGYLATKHLIESGCSRIGHIKLRGGDYTFDERTLGYRKALNEAGIQYDEKLVIECEKVNFNSSKVSLKKLLSVCPSVDGIFCSSDLIAVGITFNLNNMGKKIPDNIKVVGYGNARIGYSTTPRTTTVDIHSATIAEEGIRAFVELMDKKVLDRRDYVIPVELLINGSSTKKA